MSTNATLEAAVAQLRLDFIEGTLDRMDTLEGTMMALREPDDRFSETFQDLQRHVHSIKGQGRTFDFPSITRIAHRLEDFIEISPKIGSHELDVIQIFLDRIREVLESGQDAPEKDMPRLLQVGALDPETVARSQPSRVVEILVVMPKGLQRKIIAEELASCGFRLSMVETPVEAISYAISNKPDIIFATLEMVQMSGTELARVLEVVEATRGSRFILLTSKDDKNVNRYRLPEQTVIIHKGAGFTEELMECLIGWGMFGTFGKSA